MSDCGHTRSSKLVSRCSTYQIANLTVLVFVAKSVNNMRLQNKVMQLRKVCSHPFLFTWPVDPNTWRSVIGDELVNASGKILLLD
ncbi:hypothetical protein BS47DRAFT_1114493 [Hydnum rufescens UP504]|uniref:Uncharacterized protein n=1 Tax=Hydnum rufescens UP504 TaxID=1448309 RepID=A0A9P6DUU7_9AGAM|nr:hypothetical protein BS47DRAFT_1114493 [Hydnum rufescens UP504]